MKNASEILKDNAINFNQYTSGKGRFKSLHLKKTTTDNGRDIYVISVQRGIFRYLINKITWFFRVNDLINNMQTFKSLTDYRSIEKIASDGKIPYFKNLAPYEKYNNEIVSDELYTDPNTPDKFPNTINIAVFGEKSCGKGSLIKSLQNRFNLDSNKKPVAEKNHLAKPTQRFPLTNDIFLCELPALGVQVENVQNIHINGDVDTYKKQTKILNYNAIIITFQDFFNLDDDLTEIIESAKANNIPCYFVMTKIDIAVENHIFDQANQSLSHDDAAKTFQKQQVEDFKNMMGEKHINKNEDLIFINNRNPEPETLDFLKEKITATT